MPLLELSSGPQHAMPAAAMSTLRKQAAPAPQDENHHGGGSSWPGHLNEGAQGAHHHCFPIPSPVQQQQQMSVGSEAEQEGS